MTFRRILLHFSLGRSGVALAHCERRRALLGASALVAAGLTLPAIQAWARPDAPVDSSAARFGLDVHFLDSRTGQPVHRYVSMLALEHLTQRTIRTRTPWTDGSKDFTGPLLSDVISLVAGDLPYDTLQISALNDYVTTIPAADLRQHGVVLARLIDGQPIPVRRKGPLFVMYPFDSKPELWNHRYYARAIWQVHRIDVR